MTEDKTAPASVRDDKSVATPVAPPSAAQGPEPTGLAAGPWCMSITGLVMGLLIWVVLEWRFPFFYVDTSGTPSSGALSAEQAAKLAVETKATTLKNSIAAGILIGLLGGLGFAAVEAVARRRLLRYVPFVVLAIVLCAGLGAAAGYAAQTFEEAWRYKRSIEPMVRTLATQGIFWSILAAGVGLSLGLSTGRAGHALGTVLQVVLGAVMFGLVYVPLAGYVFPTDNAERIVPTSMANRAVWVIAALAIFGLLLGLSRQRRKPQ